MHTYTTTPVHAQWWQWKKRGGDMESTAMWHCVSFQNYIPPHVTRTQRKDKYLQAAVKGFLSMADQGLLQSGHTRVPKRHMCDMCYLRSMQWASNGP